MLSFILVKKLQGKTQKADFPVYKAQEIVKRGVSVGEVYGDNRESGAFYQTEHTRLPLPVLQGTGLNFEVRDGAGGEEAERMAFLNMIENGFDSLHGDGIGSPLFCSGGCDGDENIVQ